MPPIQNRIISTNRLGYNITCVDVGGTKKLALNIDNDTVKSDENGVIYVDLDAVGVKVVSDDAGNVISIGTDTGAFLDAHKIKQIVGEMVASATDGIDYDAVTETLHAYLSNLGVTDTDTVDLTYTENEDGNNVLQADVKLSPAGDNTLSVDVASGGLYVPKVKNHSAIDTDNGTFTVNIDGIQKVFQLTEILDCDDSVLGYMFTGA